jgi:hypothetical protein
VVPLEDVLPVPVVLEPLEVEPVWPIELLPVPLVPMVELLPLVLGELIVPVLVGAGTIPGGHAAPIVELPDVLPVLPVPVEELPVPIVELPVPLVLEVPVPVLPVVPAALLPAGTQFAFVDVPWFDMSCVVVALVVPEPTEPPVVAPVPVCEPVVDPVLPVPVVCATATAQASTRIAVRSQGVRMFVLSPFWS